MTKKFEYKPLHKGLEDHIHKCVFDYIDAEGIGQTTAAFMFSQSIINSFFGIISHTPWWKKEKQEEFKFLLNKVLETNFQLYEFFVNNAFDEHTSIEHTQHYLSQLDKKND